MLEIINLFIFLKYLLSSSSKIMGTLSENPVLGHISTFGGHPVSCAAGFAAFRVIVEQALHLRAKEAGERFRERLSHRLITEVRGEGLFLAVRLRKSELIPSFISQGVKNGLVLDYFLFCDDAFRIAPPLTISNDEIDYACNVIISTLDQLSH